VSRFQTNKKMVDVTLLNSLNKYILELDSWNVDQRTLRDDMANINKLASPYWDLNKIDWKSLK
jgi:hypothetical protein